MAFRAVGRAGVPAHAPDAPDDDRHVGLPELREVVFPVWLQAADQLLHAAPQQDVFRRALADQELVAVVLPAAGRPADQLVVVLTGPRELAVRAAEHRVAEVVVCQRKGF